VHVFSRTPFIELDLVTLTDMDVSSNVSKADLPTIDYHQLNDPDAAHRVIAEVRSQAPIAIGPLGPEVLRYELVRTVLRDERFTTARGLGLEKQGITSGPIWDRAVSNILSLDGPEHHRLRRLVAKAFAPRGAERLRALIVDVITGLVGPITAVGRCDVVKDITRGYPTPVICALLGVPPQDSHLFSQWTEDITKIFEGNVAVEGPAILAAWDELDAYLEDFVARRRTSPADDLISELIVADVDGDRLTTAEIVRLCGSLLRAGTDTVRNQLAAAVQVLCEHPRQWALLARRPELAERAVGELMRYFPVVFGNFRRAAVDVVLAGVLIPAGTLVFANTAAANRDPDVFPQPHQLDITRQNSPAMLTFGGGVHYCLGAHLARIELAEALRVIIRHLPNPHRTGPAPWAALRGITGPVSLPLAFGVQNAAVRCSDA
jgi:cytochrome P450